MTPTEFIQRQRDLRLTSVQLAAQLGVSQRTICHWRTGVFPVPRAVVLALQYLWNRKLRELNA